MKKLIVPFLLIFLVGCSSNQNTVGVVDLPNLYASFDYQKELDLEFRVLEEKIDGQKDSLTGAIQMIEMSLAQSSDYSEADKGLLFERAYANYLDEQQYLDYVKDSVANQYSVKVWKQLNSYMEEYGKENNYDVIIGMQGNGNVMYAKEGINITEDVIAYANNKYNGN